MNKTKLFVSFAPEDKKEGNMLGEQCRNPFSTFEVIGGSEEGQGNGDWETQTRERMKQARVVLMIVGKNTAKAANVIWEIKVAREEGIPVIGVYVDKAYQESLPETFGSGPVIEWNWEYVYNTILRIVK
jgi:hypothetical protein